MALTWVRIGNLKGPTGNVGTFYQRTLGTSDTLEGLESGAYSIHSGAVAEGLGLPNSNGSLIIIRGADVSRTALHTTRSASPVMYANSRLSTGWTGWVKLTGIWYNETPLTSSDHLNNITVSGIRTCWSGTVAAAVGSPVEDMFDVETILWGTGAGRQTLTTRNVYSPQVLIRTLAGVTWQPWILRDDWLSAIALTSSDHLDNITVSGIRTCWSGTVAAAVGSPVVSMFDIETVLWGTGAGRQTLTTRSLDAPQTWKRSLFNTTWLPFQRMDAGGGSGGGSGSSLPPASPSGLKIAAMSLNVGVGSTETTGQGFVRSVVKIPEGVVRGRLVIKNWSPRYGFADSPAVALSNMSVGPRSGSTGQATSWQLISASGSTDTDGYTSPWFNFTANMIGNDCLVSYGWQSDGVVQQTQGFAYTGASAAGALTGSGNAVKRMPLYAYLELQTIPTLPTVASFTDSIGVGANADRELYDSWLDQYCRANGYVPMHWGNSGDSAPSWVDPNAKKWKLYGRNINQVDAVIYGMNSNQIYAASEPSLQQIIDDTTACVENLRRHVSPNVYGATVIPRTDRTGARETIRRQYNAWMKSSPLFQDVFDMSAAVSADDETLRPEFDADGLHLNTAGYAAMAAAIARPVVGV